MIHGLSVEQFKLLNENLLEPLRQMGAELWVFGSRARGNHSQYSDVDLLVSLPEPNPQKLRLMRGLLDQFRESRFPFRVDLVVVDDLAASYRDQILQERVRL